MRLTYKDENFKEYCSITTVPQLTQKLGQLEDIEEELGISLITLFAILDNGFWHRSSYLNIYDYYSTDAYDLCFDKKRKAIRVIDKKDICFQGLFGLKDYGKTWALDKKELTKEELK